MRCDSELMAELEKLVERWKSCENGNGYGRGLDPTVRLVYGLVGDTLASLLARCKEEGEPLVPGFLLRRLERAIADHKAQTGMGMGLGEVTLSYPDAQGILDTLKRRCKEESEPEAKEEAAYRSGRVSFSPEAWHGLGLCRQEGCTCPEGEELP